MDLIDKVGKRLHRWFGGTDVLECDDPLASALPPYDARPWPVCTPRVGETFGRYRERARRSQERALLEVVWRVTAAPDGDGVWRTNVDQITRKRDALLDNGFTA